MVERGGEGKLEKKEKWEMEKTMALVLDVRRAGMRKNPSFLSIQNLFHTQTIQYYFFLLN